MNRAFIALAGLLAILLFGGIGVLGYQHFAAASQGAAPQIGGPFALVDGDGKTVTDQDFRGKYMLIYFGYTHCPDACPTALNDIALALDKLGEGRKRVQPIFITVDPERDTGPVVADYVKAFSPDIIGLTGTAAAGVVEANWALESGLYDFRAGAWASDICRACGVDPGWLGPVVPSGSFICTSPSVRAPCSTAR